MDIGQGKVFERPQGGAFVGTIIDVVDMPKFATKYGSAVSRQGRTTVHNRRLLQRDSDG